jgi:glycosyltransferase involved in cell wall biosynthesis
VFIRSIPLIKMVRSAAVDKVVSSSRILSVSLFVPYSGIPHAGGEYVFRHYGLLSKRFALRVFAPRTRENEVAARAAADHDYESSLIGHGRTMQIAALRLFIPIVKYIRGVSLGLDVEVAFCRNESLQSAAREADVIEFQWTETASLSRYFRRVAPQARQVLVAHDILSQRWDRRSRSETTLLRRLFYAGRLLFSRMAERRRFAAVDTVVVFSEKDGNLVKELYAMADVRVVNPPLMDEEMNDWIKPSPSKRPAVVLFTGALSRMENHEAIMWFINNIWTRVKAEAPDTVLVVAGASPDSALVDLAERRDDIEVTGRVDDLAPYYKEADVFISPMLNGAGVKFKNITAMLWGVPILSTPVGAEGIGSEELYLDVTESIEEFTASLVTALNDKERRVAVSAAAREWAFSMYGDDQFAERMESIYPA